MIKNTLAVVVTGTAALLALTACGSTDGKILEREDGRNGVKVEVSDGMDNYEVYLIKGTECEVDDYIHDCADADDYLVPATGATPGVNANRSGDDGDDD